MAVKRRLTAREAAAVIGIDPYTLRHIVALGDLTPLGEPWLFDPESVDTYRTAMERQRANIRRLREILYEDWDETGM